MKPTKLRPSQGGAFARPVVGDTRKPRDVVVVGYTYPPRAVDAARARDPKAEGAHLAALVMDEAARSVYRAPGALPEAARQCDAVYVSADGRTQCKLSDGHLGPCCYFDCFEKVQVSSFHGALGQVLTFEVDGGLGAAHDVAFLFDGIGVQGCRVDAARFGGAYAEVRPIATKFSMAMIEQYAQLHRLRVVNLQIVGHPQADACVVVIERHSPLHGNSSEKLFVGSYHRSTDFQNTRAQVPLSFEPGPGRTLAIVGPPTPRYTVALVFGAR